MQNSYVLGICGNAGAGKDMIADHLCKELGFYRLAFTTPIKDIAHKYFGVPWDQLQKSDKPEKVRRLLQKLGTDIGRDYDPDVWVNFLCRQIQEIMRPKIVITDVRFPNEAEALVRIFGADLILIRRPDNPNAAKPMMDHASERSVEQIPFNLIRTAFINLEGRQAELLDFVLANVKEWIRCHSSLKIPM